MSGGQRFVSLAAICLLLTGWAYASEPQIGLAAWGTLRTGSALGITGLLLMVTGLRRQDFDRWLPRPIHTGFALSSFGVSMIAMSRSGLWLVAPATAAGAVALALGSCDRRQPLLPGGEAARPTLDERVRFWFIAALPWAALYVFTAQMRLPGRAFQFEFESRMPFFPVEFSLPYELMYGAVAAAPFLAATRRQLRKLILSVWISSALVFPIYWLVPSTGPGLDPLSTGVLARLLSYQHREFASTAAFPSFHVLWAIFVGELIRPRWAGWVLVAVISVSCITSRMHYVPDVLAALALSPFLADPEQRLWQPLRRAAQPAGIGSAQLAWMLWSGLAALILFSLWLRSTPWALLAGVGLIGVGLTWFAWNSRLNRSRWLPGLTAIAGAALTVL
jgi:hypothetical protein